MKKRTHWTITGRRLDLDSLGRSERDFLGVVLEKYEGAPEWSAFASWWFGSMKAAGLEAQSTAYRVCQDLEARLGIAQGKVAPPDYRDYLADLIEERYGSRYRFCKETGVDPGHLSRVLSSRSDLSLQNLQRILDALHASLIIRPEEDLAEVLSPEGGADGKEDTVALDPLDYRLLQGLAGIAAKQREDELQVWLRRYLDEEISLAKLAESIGVSRCELMERFDRLGLPLRSGPSNAREASEEVETARKSG
jgi:transcriptional regulator with XRE-family HTH domain